MEHIRTPVRIGGHDAGDYISIQEADGSYKQTMQGMAEIVQAINEYDDLIAERDELRAQRAALVEALAQAVAELGSIIDQKGHTGVTREIQDVGRAALKLARGKR
jgi:hypothetical protein